MVTAYRRHEARCKYAKKKKYPEPRKHKDCICPVHMDDGWLDPVKGISAAEEVVSLKTGWGRVCIFVGTRRSDTVIRQESLSRFYLN